MLKDENVLLNQKLSFTMVEGHHKEELITELVKNKNDENTEMMKDISFKDSVKVYKVTSGDEDDAIGVIRVRDYPSKKNSTELVLNMFKDMNVDALKELINLIVTKIVVDPKVEFIIMRVEENKKNIISAIESIGFIRDGLFISNQIKSEFLYYYVYTYKLI